MTLAEIYLDLAHNVFDFGGGSCGPNDIANWLMTRHGYARRQACAIARILYGWMMSEYVPASLLRYC